MRISKAILATVFLMVSLASCGNRGADEANKSKSTRESSSEESLNGVYYWKTVFKLGEEERRFIREHAIERMYLRLFDVDVPTTSESSSKSIIPVATTIFKDSIPEGVEIVPTVFITVSAIREMTGQVLGTDDLALKILRRILNMADYNDLGPVREIPLDCDWTSTTQEGYYDLCEELKSQAGKDGISISSTIRLHQLRSDPPPVDRGVLMLYNTGAFKVPGKRNSILEYDDVKQYLNVSSTNYN